MADTFDAIAQAAVVQMVDELGVSATYTPSGGGPSSITCVLTKRIEDELEAFDRPVYEEQYSITFDLAETPNLGKNDTVVIGANTYTVVELIEDDGFTATANVKDTT